MLLLMLAVALGHVMLVLALALGQVLLVLALALRCVPLTVQIRAADTDEEAPSSLSIKLVMVLQQDIDMSA